MFYFLTPSLMVMKMFDFITATVHDRYSFKDNIYNRPHVCAHSFMTLGDILSSVLMWWHKQKWNKEGQSQGPTTFAPRLFQLQRRDGCFGQITAACFLWGTISPLYIPHGKIKPHPPHLCSGSRFQRLHIQSNGYMKQPAETEAG